MSVKCTLPYTPLLYSKTGVCRGIHFFLIFALKHRLWVLIRTASMRRFECVPTINVLEQKKKDIIIFHLKINIFTAVEYCCILHGCVCVMISSDKIVIKKHQHDIAISYFGYVLFIHMEKS